MSVNPSPSISTKIGNSDVPSQVMTDLKSAWKEHRLALFLGAGVSAPYGIPGWNDLVLDLVMNQSRTKFEQFWPHYRRPLAQWLAEYSNFSPLALARIVKRNAKLHESVKSLPAEQQQRKFMTDVRDALYRHYKPNQTDDETADETALEAVANLLKSSQDGAGVRNIPMVVTTNFDNLLELELKTKGIAAESIFTAARPAHTNIQILHVHGYLPKDGTVPDAPLVFTEDDYHALSYSVFHWALAAIASCFRNYTVLFVGQSLSDPNLRRLLDATLVKEAGTVHYLLRKNYEIPDDQAGRDERERVATRIAQEAADYASKTGEHIDEVKTRSEIDQAIDVMLEQAHTYDTALFEEMGVKTIWIKSYGDIALILKQIAK